ncbi:unnamed protein product [Cochlearia groenlandica]
MQSNEEFIKFLGEGSYGCVNLIKYTNSSADINDGSSSSSSSSFLAAVKTSSCHDYDSLHKELEILKELRGYPHIIRSYGDYLEQSLNPNGFKVYKLLLEYASFGSLNDFMDNYLERKLPDNMIRDFTRMILQGLVSIHGHGYVHCDLKSDNLLIFPSSCTNGDEDSSLHELKISDFGNCLEVGDVPDFWETSFPFVGTPIYMPPESLDDGVANKSIDLWSLGCLVLEMYTGERPWQGLDIDELATCLFDGKAPEIPEKDVPCDARQFIETCFARNPEERGSASELLLHRFLCEEEEEEEKKKTEEIVVSDVYEEEKTEKKIVVSDVSVSKEKRHSLLLKLRLRIRGASKKSIDIAEKPLKLKVLKSKPQMFKKVLSKLLRLKNMRMKPNLCSNSVFVR